MSKLSKSLSTQSIGNSLFRTKPLINGVKIWLTHHWKGHDVWIPKLVSKVTDQVGFQRNPVPSGTLLNYKHNVRYQIKATYQTSTTTSEVSLERGRSLVSESGSRSDRSVRIREQSGPQDNYF